MATLTLSLVVVPVVLESIVVTLRMTIILEPVLVLTIWLATTVYLRFQAIGVALVVAKADEAMVDGLVVVVALEFLRLALVPTVQDQSWCVGNLDTTHVWRDHLHVLLNSQIHVGKLDISGEHTFVGLKLVPVWGELLALAAAGVHIGNHPRVLLIVHDVRVVGLGQAERVGPETVVYRWCFVDRRCLLVMSRLLWLGLILLLWLLLGFAMIVSGLWVVVLPIDRVLDPHAQGAGLVLAYVFERLTLVDTINEHSRRVHVRSASSIVL